MSDATIDGGFGPESAPSEGRLGRIAYRLAILVLFVVACYSTFEGLKAVSGNIAIAFVLTGLFQGALLGAANFLGRELAKYASGRKGARISAGGRRVRYGLPILIYVLCLALCVFFAFTFWHRLLLDRGTGLDITLPKITQLASDYVAGDLTGTVVQHRRGELRLVTTKPPVAAWITSVRQVNADASTDAIAKTLAESIFQTEKRAATERADLRKQANDTINKENDLMRTQAQRVTMLTAEKETRDKRRADAEVRLKALRAARADELGPAAPNPARDLPANSEAYRLTKNLACQAARKSGEGDCFNALELAIKQAELPLKEPAGQNPNPEQSLRETNEALAGARERLAAAQKRLEDNPAITMPTGPVVTSGDARLKATEQNLERFTREPTSAAFLTVSRDCLASTDALGRAGAKPATAAACRPSEVEAEATAFTEYVARHDAYITACGDRKPVEAAEAIERDTRAALRGVHDQAAQRRVDEALRKTFSDLAGDCIAKARAIHSKVATEAGKVEEAARSFVATSVLDRDPQDRAFDALASLFKLRGGLPVAGAAFLAFLQETLILCFSFLLHLSNPDRQGSSSSEHVTRLAGRSRIIWTPQGDDTLPVLAAKFLYTALEVTPDGGGRLSPNYADDEPDDVAVNADVIIKELARQGFAREDRKGTWALTHEGIEEIVRIVREHHDSMADDQIAGQDSASVPGGSAAAVYPGGGASPASSGRGRASSTSQAGVVDKTSAERGSRPNAADGGSHTAPEVGRSSEIEPASSHRRQGRPRDASYAFRRRKDDA